MSREEEAPSRVKLADSERVNPKSTHIILILFWDNLVFAKNNRTVMIQYPASED